MRALFLVGSLLLILSDSRADAESISQPRSAPPPIAEALKKPSDRTPHDRPTPSDRERIAQYLAQCLKDWDAATHMTKTDWARVCKRVVDNRAKFRLEQGLGLPSWTR